jgi:phospholipid-binding lipoprotein MlaA
MTTTSLRFLARRAGFGLLLAVLFVLGGCATVAQPNPRDPFESFNRSMFSFNDELDKIVLKPVATVYRDHVPPLVRTGVSNFFGNLGDAWSAVNSALQLKIPDAAENALRFGINTTFGFAGIFDLASEMHIERHKEDFGQTLGRWGVPAGPYLMLPLLGPSTVRDAAVIPIERRYDLLRQVKPDGTRYVLFGTKLVNQRANLLRVGNVLEEAALDRYTFSRDAHLQRRRSEVYERGDDRGQGGGVPPKLVDERTPEQQRAPAPAPAR